MRFPTPFVLCATALLLLQACSTTESPTESQNPPQTDTTAITGEHYIQAVVDGVVETQQEAQTSEWVTQMKLEGGRGFGGGPEYRVFYLAGFSRSSFSVIDDPSYQSLRIGFMYTFPEQPSEAEAYDVLVHMGSMNFGSRDGGINGVEIQWKDKAGTIWKSSSGTGDQTGSNFTVTEHKRTVRQPGGPTIPRYNTKGTFNCKLYDGKGNSIDVKNGKFSIWTIFDY